MLAYYDTFVRLSRLFTTKRMQIHVYLSNLPRQVSQGVVKAKTGV